MDEKTVKFNKTLKGIGGSVSITLPPELVNYIDAKPEDDVIVIGDINSKGQKYVAIFKEKKETTTQ